MLKKLIWNDVRQNKLLSAATVFFMAVSAMMLSLTALLFSSLLGSVNGLMEQAQAPDLVQMHTGEINGKLIDSAKLGGIARHGSRNKLLGLVKVILDSGEFEGKGGPFLILQHD